ncbi:hypothetical protein MMC08_001602 [Hypocenomyce scalaris]|nr:hypothetical protein [Hypocenomyce scalaris]
MPIVTLSTGVNGETEPPGRYFVNPAPPLLKVPSPRTNLLQSLTKIVTSCPPDNPWKILFNGKPAVMDLFMGPTSIAYLFLTLTHTHPDLLISNETPGHWCRAYLACGQDAVPFEPAEGGPTGQTLGIANEFLAYHSVKAAATQDLAEVDIIMDALADVSIDKALNEHLKGRAGALSLLRFVRQWLPASSEKVNAAMGSLIEVAFENGNPWSYNGTQYPGAVHGDIGIITQIVLSDPSYAPQLEGKLSTLLDLQTESGNWPV